MVLEVWEAFREEHEGKKKQTREVTLPCANHNLLGMCLGEIKQPRGGHYKSLFSEEEFLKQLLQGQSQDPREKIVSSICVLVPAVDGD